MEQKIKAVFAAHPTGREKAKEIAKLYQAAGMEAVFREAEDFAENRDFAEKEGMTHLLYFSDEEHITMVSFADEMGGFTVEILLSDLQLPQI